MSAAVLLLQAAELIESRTGNEDNASLSSLSSSSSASSSSDDASSLAGAQQQQHSTASSSSSSASDASASSESSSLTASPVVVDERSVAPGANMAIPSFPTVIPPTPHAHPASLAPFQQQQQQHPAYAPAAPSHSFPFLPPYHQQAPPHYNQPMPFYHPGALPQHARDDNIPAAAAAAKSRRARSSASFSYFPTNSASAFPPDFRAAPGPMFTNPPPHMMAHASSALTPSSSSYASVSPYNPPSVSASKSDSDSSLALPVVKRARTTSTSSTGSSSGARNAVPDEWNKEKTRKTHNLLEKNRRAHLKDCFLVLKQAVPEIVGKPKTSTVGILQHAREFIVHVREQLGSQESEIAQLAAKKEELLSKLKQTLPPQAFNEIYTTALGMYRPSASELGTSDGTGDHDGSANSSRGVKRRADSISEEPRTGKTGRSRSALKPTTAFASGTTFAAAKSAASAARRRTQSFTAHTALSRQRSKRHLLTSPPPSEEDDDDDDDDNNERGGHRYRRRQQHRRHGSAPSSPVGSEVDVEGLSAGDDDDGGDDDDDDDDGDDGDDNDDNDDGDDEDSGGSGRRVSESASNASEDATTQNGRVRRKPKRLED